MGEPNFHPDFEDNVENLSLCGIRQVFVDCENHGLDMLVDICTEVAKMDYYAVIYCNTHETVLLVADHLRGHDFQVLSLNASEENLSETNHTIRDFRERHRGFLVSTQMPLIYERYELNCYVPLTVHYEMPKTHEDIIARMGKSGRRGRRSSSIMLAKDDNDKKFIISECKNYGNIEEMPCNFFNDL